MYALPMLILPSLSVDEILPRKYVNWSTNFRNLLLNEMAPSWSKAYEPFYPSFQRKQCLLLSATGYEAEIHLEQVCLQEALHQF